MILLTGATGKIGSETAKALAAKGVKARALVRNPEKAAALKALDIDIAIGTRATPPASARRSQASSGCWCCYRTASGSSSSSGSSWTSRRSAGVRHVVKGMSSMEALRTPTAAIPQIHWASEEHLRRSGLAWTMIKPNFFMQNLLASARSIKENKSFSMPMGNGKTAMSDARDIGAVTGEAIGQGPRGQGLRDLPGRSPEFGEVAERFTDALGTKITYVAADRRRTRRSSRRCCRTSGTPTPYRTSSGESPRAGQAHDGYLQKLMGREPISLARFIRDHISAFK